MAQVDPVNDSVIEAVNEQVELPIEEWRPITNFATYSVSNHGRIRNYQTGRILQPKDNGTGYHFVGLCNQGHRTNCYVHRLVVQEFIGPIPEGMEAEHADRNRANNNVSNLRIVSKSENNRNKTTYNGHVVEYLDELPDGAEPITEAHGRAVAAGHYRHGREYYVFVESNRQYRRLTHTRSHTNGWMVKVKGANGERITISWTD